jgi:hypothetical protein
VVVTGDVIAIGSLVVGVALGLIAWFGRRHNIHEARFDSTTGEEIE